MAATILAIGLLLLVAGFGSARIPGGATFARPGIGRSPGIAFNPIRAFILSPVHPSTWYANASILIGFFVAIAGFAVVAGLTAAGISTLVALIGVVILVAAVEASRIVARVERSRTFLGERVQPLPHPYRAFGDWPFGLLRDELLDESRWRDVLYVLVNLPLAVIEFAVVLTAWAIALAIVTMPVWYDAAPGAVGPNVLGPLEAHDAAIIVLRTALGFGLLALAASLSQVVISLHRSVVVGLLCAPESRELERQVETLRRSRSAVLDSEATELGRIERDLHDGAQQRLVMLSIDLGLANE